jgi:hypothetical protein
MDFKLVEKNRVEMWKKWHIQTDRLNGDIAVIKWTN